MGTYNFPPDLASAHLRTDKRVEDGERRIKEGHHHTFRRLKDVDTDGVKAGDVMVYDGYKWKPGASGAVSTIWMTSTADQTIANTTLTVVNWGGGYTSAGFGHDPAEPHKITCTAIGNYLVTAMVMFRESSGGTGGARIIELKGDREGTLQATGTSAGNGAATSLSFAGTVRVGTAGGALWVQATQHSGGSKILDSGSQMSVAYLGPALFTS